MFQSFEFSIYVIKIGLLSIWPVLLSTLCSQHPVPTHPSPQRSTLLCWGWGDRWMGTGCWYSGLPTAAAARITASVIWNNLWSHINYSSSRPRDVVPPCNMRTL